ncbi:MAG: hypothetical protein WCO79_00045 [bacterium]
MKNVIIQIVALFVALVAYFSMLNAQDKNNWVRALVLAVAIPLLGLLPVFMGGWGWLIGFVVALLLVSKVLGESFGGSLLFLIGIGIVQTVVQLVVNKFL